MPSPCGYPPCEGIATESRGVVMEPEPIMVNLCPDHIAILEANERDEQSADFWRWWHAMSGVAG